MAWTTVALMALGAAAAGGMAIWVKVARRKARRPKTLQMEGGVVPHKFR